MPPKAKTLAFLQSKDYFGLSSDNVVVFEQGTLPCLSPEGKLMLRSPTALARAPNGNGGLYKAMADNGVLQSMEERGIKWAFVYGYV